MKTTHVAVLSIVALLAVGAPLVAIFSLSLSQAASQIQLQSSLVGSSPATPIDNIPSGGAPWVLTAGEAGISSSGILDVNVVGLVIPSTGTTGPVVSIFASLLCQGTTGSLVASTDPVPLASNGNAHIHQAIALPTKCAGPIILIRIYATTAGVVTAHPWIASTGLSG